MIAPASKPQRKEADIRKLLARHRVTDAVALVGVRGYYSETFAPSGNNRKVYDDGIFLVAPGYFASFNANADPGAFRKGIANLKPGLWRYKVGIHGLGKPKAQQYKALVQADKVTVARDQQGDDTGWFGINIHRGGYNTTSSLGCQTIPPSQWSAFIESVQDRLKRAGQSTIPYLLVEE